MMHYLTFVPEEYDSYPVCFLVPDMNQDSIKRRYVDAYFADYKHQVLAYQLKKEHKRTPAVVQKAFLADLLPILRELDVRYLVVTDAEYFKTLTRGKGPEAHIGYVVDSAGEYRDDDGTTVSFEGFNIVYAPNPATAYRDMKKFRHSASQAMTALQRHATGHYTDPGCDIIKYAAYPESVADIRSWLETLLNMDCDLSSDIETFTLRHYSAGIGTITFCWNQHEGICFPVDLVTGEDGMPVDRDSQDVAYIRTMLRDFFNEHSKRGHKMLWHNICFDVYVLVYQLYMQDILDIRGMLQGLEDLLRSWEDTQLITYLATNSCSGNVLGLKPQSQEFSGNYSVDLSEKSIRDYPLGDILRYNLIDGLSTWFVYNKHLPTMVLDDQESTYRDLFKPAVKDIIQMQLTGLPINIQSVRSARSQMQSIMEDATTRMLSNSLVERYLHDKILAQIEIDNAKLKKKTRTYEEAAEKVGFSPRSSKDLVALLYGDRYLALPVIDLTDTKQPSTGGETLEKLKNHCTSDEGLEFIEALLSYKIVDKLDGTFLKAFEDLSVQGPDGWHYLHGKLKLGGTVSGRLSSSDPNLQNLPSNGKGFKKEMVNLVKSCVQAPPGYLFVGLDFSSLEDRISALQTKDPQKLKVYTDGYDGHSLRAYSYFDEQMPDIDPDSVDSINSIQVKYKGLRTESKTPTFLLTYGGTWKGIVDQMGWDSAKAKMVEQRYHDLYQVSDEWVANKIEQASKTGYVTVAFGLRVRTPLLIQTVIGTKKTPFEAESEARTAGNALGQSYGLLNTRAGIEFMGKVRSSEYQEDIRPCVHIHDAQYFLIPENMAVLRYMNKHLVEAVEWQEDPEIWHEEVKLGGELSIFYPTWTEEMVIPNGATSEKILELAEKHWTTHCVD